MPKIVFLCSHDFSGDDVRNKALGGIETATILLAEGLVELGHRVTVYNGRDSDGEYKGVSYQPIATIGNIETDVAIASSYTNFLENISAKLPMVWQHNRITFSKIWKRRELGHLLKIKPALVTLSNDALKNTPWYVPYRSRHVIPHAIEKEFLEPKTPGFADREQSAFFASRPSRNLDWLMNTWKQSIHPRLPDAKLYVCIPPTATFKFNAEELAQHNILYQGSIPKKDLKQLINRCRLLLYPGHINETGCQVALQAIGLGLPTISCGIGSLKDLVITDSTGFIATDKEKYANKAIDCFTDETLWNRLHTNTLSHPWRKTYLERAKDWDSLIKTVL